MGGRGEEEGRISLNGNTHVPDRDRPPARVPVGGGAPAPIDGGGGTAAERDTERSEHAAFRPIRSPLPRGRARPLAVAVLSQYLGTK